MGPIKSPLGRDIRRFENRVSITRRTQLSTRIPRIGTEVDGGGLGGWLAAGLEHKNQRFAKPSEPVAVPGRSVTGFR